MCIWIYTYVCVIHVTWISEIAKIIFASHRDKNISLKPKYNLPKLSKLLKVTISYLNKLAHLKDHTHKSFGVSSHVLYDGK